jgi:predicted MFS family arabinose efflux permease
VSARRPLFAFLAFGALWGGWAVLVPAVQAAVGASKASLGLALLCLGLGSLAAMTATGRLIDRGTAHVLPATFVLLAASALLPALAGTTVALGAALLVFGAASGAADVAMNAEVAALEAERRRSLMQLAHGLFSVGVIVGAVLSGGLREAGAGRLTIMAVLASAALAAAAANRHAPRRPSDRPHGRRQRVPRAVLALGAAGAVAFAIEGALETWTALYLQRDLGAGAAVSASGPAAYAAAMATGRLLGHRLAGRFPEAVLLGGGAVLAAAGLVLAGAAGSVAVAVAGFALGGAGVSLAAPLLFGAAARVGPERAAAVAAVTTTGYLGFVIGPPIVGGLAQLASLRASFVALAGAALCLAAATPRLALDAE